MTHKYTVRRKTNRRPMEYLQNVVDIVGVTSLVIRKNLNPAWNLRKSYAHLAAIPDVGSIKLEPITSKPAAKSKKRCHICHSKNSGQLQ